MTGPRKGDGFQELFRDLKHQDTARTPTFESLLVRKPVRKAWWKRPVVPIGLGFAMTGTAAVASMVLLLQFEGASREPAPMQWAQSPIPKEPLATLLDRPGSTWEGFETSPIPKRRLIGRWE